MRYLGSIKKLTSVILTKSGFNVTVSAGSASSDTEYQLPPAGGGTSEILTEDASQTVINKGIDADNNTISNIANANISATAGIDVTKLATGDVDNTEFSFLDGVTSGIQSQLDDKQNTSEKGAAGGYASLDGGGKVPASQLPASLMTLEGVWNASINTPTLADGVGDPGSVYLVSVAGTQDLGSGSQSFAVGDWVLYNASGVWQQSSNSTNVASVNGYTGVVTLTKSDLGLSNVDNTSDATKNSAAVALTNKTSIGVDNILLDGNTISTTSGVLNLESEATAAISISAGTDLMLTAGSGDSIWAYSDFILRPGKLLRFQEPAGGPRSLDVVIPNTLAASRTLTIPDADGTVALVPSSGVVRSNGSVLSTGSVSLSSEVSGTLPLANGGTGQASAAAAFDALSPMTTNGDIVTRTAGTGTRVPIGSDGQVLTVVSGAPAWAPAAASIPLGAVLATFPSLTGAYDCTATTAADSSGFVVCGGQTISDVTSPMNGVTIPDINNNAFIRGNATSGSTGGANSVTLSSVNMPAHTHNMDHGHSHTISTNTTGSGHGHSFSLSAASAGGHEHRTVAAASISGASGLTGGNYLAWARDAGNDYSYGLDNGGTGTYPDRARTSADGSHSHSVSGTVGSSDGTHTHGISGGVTSITANTGSNGSGTAFDIVPAYITARYVMRVK